MSKPEYQPIVSRDKTREPSDVVLATEEQPMSYEELKNLIIRFFSEKEFECNQAFKQGLSIPVSEDYRNVDLLCNLNEILFNYCTKDSDMSPTDKLNFKNITAGIQTITKGLKQYDSNDIDKVFVAQLTGYIIKVLRNYYHD